MSGDGLFIMCGECLAIRHSSSWTYWQRDDEDEHWRPSRPGEYDPMMRCPECGETHQDTDSDTGIWEGTVPEMLEERAKLLAAWPNYITDSQSEYRPDAVSEQDSHLIPRPTPPPKINRGQIAAFHAMTAKLDDLKGEPQWTNKTRYKRRYGMASTVDFTHAQAHQVLNEIADELASLTP